MKKIFLIIVVFTSISTFSQKTESIFFLYNNERDKIINKKNEELFLLNNQYSFIYIKNKHQKTSEPYNLVKNKLTTITNFIMKNTEKKFPEFYNDYKFYIYIKGEENSGCLIEVDKIWLVDKIIN